MALLCYSRKKKKIRDIGAEKLEGQRQRFERWQAVGRPGQRRSALSQSCPLSSLPQGCRLHTPLSPEPPEGQVTGAMLGQSCLPFCSQVPCWIRKDCMMKKCALQITYRSMRFLILPHALDNSLKSQFIACYLTFHKLRGVLWTVKKPKNQTTNQTQKTPTPKTNPPPYFFTRWYLGKRKKGERKVAASLSLIELASVGEEMRATAVSVSRSPELVLPGQAHRTRNSARYLKRVLGQLV